MGSVHMLGCCLGAGGRPWHPKNLGLSAFYHWNVADLSGTDVTQWTDQIGTAHLPGAAGKRPTQDTTNRVLDFASGDVLTGSIALGADATVLVYATTTSVANSYVWAGTGPALIAGFVGTDDVEYYWVARQTLSATPGSTLHTFAVAHTDTGFLVSGWYDGAAVFTDVSDIATQAGKVINVVGGANSTPLNPYVGKIRTLAVALRRLTTAEVLQFHNWCAGQ